MAGGGEGVGVLFSNSSILAYVNVSNSNAKVLVEKINEKQLKMRIELVILGSLVLSTSVVGNAYYQKKQFYPSVVHITKSNPSMMVTQQFCTAKL